MTGNNKKSIVECQLKLQNPVDSNPQKEEQEKTTFIWKEPKLAANLGGLGTCHHLSTTPKAMNFSLNSDQEYRNYRIVSEELILSII